MRDVLSCLASCKLENVSVAANGDGWRVGASWWQHCCFIAGLINHCASKTRLAVDGGCFPSSFPQFDFGGRQNAPQLLSRLARPQSNNSRVSLLCSFRRTRTEKELTCFLLLFPRQEIRAKTGFFH